VGMESLGTRVTRRDSGPWIFEEVIYTDPGFKGGDCLLPHCCYGKFLTIMGLESGTSYACPKSIFKIQMFILIHFTNLAAQNAAKQLMAKYHAEKSLSNNARSVVKSLPP